MYPTAITITLTLALRVVHVQQNPRQARRKIQRQHRNLQGERNGTLHIYYGCLGNIQTFLGKLLHKLHKAPTFLANEIFRRHSTVFEKKLRSVRRRLTQRIGQRTSPIDGTSRASK